MQMSRALEQSILTKPEIAKAEEMNPVIYYSFTTLIYVICVIGGIFVSNLGIVFDLISALTLSFICFIWPGGFYLMAERRYGEIETKDKRKIHRIHAIF